MGTKPLGPRTSTSLQTKAQMNPHAKQRSKILDLSSKSCPPALLVRQLRSHSRSVPHISSSFDAPQLLRCTPGDPTGPRGVAHKLVSASRTASFDVLQRHGFGQKRKKVFIASKALIIWAIFQFFSQSKRFKKISNFKSRFIDSLVCRLELWTVKPPLAAHESSRGYPPAQRLLL